MRQTYLPFALQDTGQEEIDAVTACLNSGWITTGKECKKFEEKFSAFLGGDVQSIAVNSATMGMQIALEGLGITKGDEVITTPYTFSATAMVCVHLGAKPVFVDICPRTLNIDVDKIEAAITPKTKAILPVHIAGHACEMDKVLSIASRYNLKVVEDAAHAFPTTYNKKLIGILDSDAAVFSFYATKTMTTGEGGMIVTKNKDLIEFSKRMRLHGISRDVFDRYTTKGAKWYYEITAPGYKCNLTDLAASIGVCQLEKAQNFQKRRQDIAHKYLEAFKDLPVELPYHDDNMHSWHLFILRLREDAPIKRDAFIETMERQYNIGCSVHFIPLHLHSYWRDLLQLKQDDFPEAYQNYLRAVSLPIYTKMTDQDVDDVIQAVREILKG
jgi:dTDP-4-amino-4,6-dideoxygalactose transaminase